MDNQRLFLFGSFFFVLFLIWNTWQEEHAPQQPVASSIEQALPDETGETSSAPGGDVPSVSAVEGEQATAESQPATQQQLPTVDVAASDIHVVTDVLDLTLSTRGADIVEADLRKYPQSKDKPESQVELLSTAGDRLYVAQSGLRTSRGSKAPDHTTLYDTAKRRYAMNDADTLEVVFSWKSDDGLVVDKIYRFRRGAYAIELDYRVRNTGTSEWRGDSYLQFKKRQVGQERKMFEPSTYSYVGPAFYDGESYEKLTLDDITEQALNKTAQGGWIAMLQHYFLAAAIPPAETQNVYYADAAKGNTYRAGVVQPEQTVPAGQEILFAQRLYIGPKLQEHLAEVAPKLELSVDYGVLTIIAEPLFYLLDLIHGIIGNWGFAIIILTFMIKALFYKLSEASGKSMAKMRKMQPKLTALKERYADDREKLNKAMMELYQKEKINPFAGCLPILIQMPVFIALYWVLLESVELRQAPFVFWLNDLSTPDSLYILPVLMGIAMFGQMRLNPQPPDPIQAKIMMLMPLMMIAFATIMPSGLVLYWVVNTVLTAAQQWQINRVIDKQGLRH